MDDREFVAAVESLVLTGSDFRHAEHVRLAWLYLRDYPVLEAIERFTRTLRRFAAHHGAADKYHETITWAYLLLIHERMHRDAVPLAWEDFRAANPDLFGWVPSILDRYYAPQTLRSDLARKIFVLPDRAVGGAQR